jgi:NADH dehydrogenase
LRGTISSIDLDHGHLCLDAGDFTGTVPLTFRHLVLTLGGIVDLSRVPGMPEHAYLMKNVGDALKLRATIIDRFEEANLQSDPAERRRLLTFVIVGGGYSGVETAGQINDLGEEIVHFYPRLNRDEFRVVLVHSQAHLLPEVSEALGRYCEEHLRSRSVELVLNARVTAMTAGRVIVGEGQLIESHTVISTVGNAPHPLLTGLCKAGAFDCSKGRIICDATLRVAGQERLWAAGDCAAVPMPPPDKTSPTDPHTYCPPTAQFATRQGALLGENLARVLEHREPKPFTFRGLGELASIGHRAAVADIMGVRFSGFIAWFVWRTIYLMKLPGLERKLRVMIDWTLDLFFPRDITLFQSKPTQLLQEMHLEAGDQLVRAGERAFSMYVVKSGCVELRDGGSQVERTIREGQHFGTRTLRDNRRWRFDAVATEPTTLVAVSARVFETLDGSGVWDQKETDVLTTT